jgi:septal ring factor EnvC (AmiA/AmiB activator)
MELTVGHWITIALGVLTWAVTLGAYVYRSGKQAQSVDDRFRSQGERIGDAETTVAKNGAKIEEFGRKTQQLEFHVAELAKDFGETKSSISRVADTLSAQAERSRQDEKEIIDRLARIEEQMRFLVTNHASNRETER